MREKIINIIIFVLLILLTVVIFINLEYLYFIRLITLVSFGIILLVLLIIEEIKCNNFEADIKDKILMGFGAWASVSAVFSINVKKSILGETFRYEGLLTFFTYIILYFCAKKHVKKENISKMFLAMQIICIFNCILGILQNYIEPYGGWLSDLFTKGVCGTFGNINFMGSFVCLCVPLFVLSYIINNNKFSLFVSMLTFYCMVGCITRSAWIGFGVFVICLIIYLIKNYKKEYLIRSLITLAIFILIFSFMFFIEKKGINRKINSIKYDLSVINDEELSGEAGSGRLAIWRICFELIRNASYSWCWS